MKSGAGFTTWRFGLLGHPVAASLSPQLHAAAGRLAGLGVSYECCDAADGEAATAVCERVRRESLDGLNVTMPWKAWAAARCEPAAEGARFSVNALRRRNDGALEGIDLDGPGLLDALGDAGADPAGARILIVGSGGAATAAAQALAGPGAVDRVFVTARRNAAAAELVQRVRSAGSTTAIGAVAWGQAASLHTVDLCIHATAIGHLGAAALEPDPFAWLPWAAWARRGVRAADLVYAPAGPTAFERAAAPWLADRVLNRFGRAMLVAQAARSFGWWTGHAIDRRALAVAAFGPPTTNT